MKPPFLLGLRGRLILILLAAFAALVGLIVAHTMNHGADQLRNAETHLQHNAQLIAARQNHIVAQADAILTGLMLNPALQPGAPADACAQALASRLAHEKKFAQIGKALPDGEIDCLAVPATNRINIADRNYFKAALQSNDLVTSDVITSRSQGNPVVVFAKAMRNSAGQVSGLLFVSIDLTRLHEELAATRLPDDARLVVVDAKGTVAVRYPDPEGWGGKSAANLSLLQRIQATGGEGTAEDIGLDGERRLFAYVKLLDTVTGPMTLWLAVPKAVIEAPVRRELALGLGIALAVLIVALGLVAWGGSRLVMGPLLKLSRVAQRFSAGDYGARSGLPHGDDEIGRLARTIDETAASVEDRERRLLRATRALRVLSAGNRTLLVATDEPGLLDAMCRTIVEAGGYHLAWVGYARADKRIEVIASWGATAGLLDELDMTWDETETGRGPTGTAIRRGIPVVSANTQTDPDYAHWRDLAQRQGIGSALALPLRLDGTVIGALCICATETDAFDAEVAELLSESADDLAHGIAVQRAKAEHERTRAELKQMENRNALILAAAGEGIFGLDLEGRATFINPAAVAMLQWTPDKVAG